MSGRRFQHWVYLNEEGMKLYGDVFPDGQVPVLVMLTSEAKLGAPEFLSEVYLIYHEEMKPEQVELLLEKLAARFNVDKEDIRAQMLKDRLPLRRLLTNGAGTDGLVQFI